jgi:hypothetical protein
MLFQVHCPGGVVLITSAKKLIGALGITVCTAAAGTGTIDHLASDRATAPEVSYTGTGLRSAAVTSIVLTVTKQGSGTGTVTSSPAGINCGAVCDQTYANATPVTLTVTPDPGSIFTGWLGACSGVGTCNLNVSAATNVSATFGPNIIAPLRIDVDANQAYDTLTDGLIILRYLSGLTGSSLAVGALGPGATLTNPVQLLAHLDDLKPALDVDGNGQADALTDGLMIIRYLFGLRGDSLLAGAVGTGATRTTAALIEPYIQALMPFPITNCSAGGPYGGGEPSGVGGTVTATILDQSGNGVVGQPAYMCGLNICSPPVVTGAGGNVSISTSLSEKKPAFKFGDSINYAEFAIPVALASTTNFGNITTGKFPALGTGGALTPGTNPASGDVMVFLASGAIVQIDTLTYSTANQQKLRTVSIPVAGAAPVLASCPGCGFQLLYGVTPAETTICPAAQVRVALPHQISSPNDFGWLPGAAVEFWITTIDSGQTYAPYGGWKKISDGTVSADGVSVSTSGGQGFNFLQNFAVRLKP